MSRRHLLSAGVARRFPFRSPHGHRAAVGALQEEMDALRAEAASAGPEALERFVRTELPRLTRIASAGGSLPPDAPPLVHAACQQISAALARTRTNQRRQAQAGAGSSLALLEEQRRAIDRFLQGDVGDPDLFALVALVDHANAQMHRHALRAVVLAGGPWPGVHRADAPLIDVVRGAKCGVAAYQQVAEFGDWSIGVAGPVVEPLMLAVGELLDNATRAGAAQVQVLLTAGPFGAVVGIADQGVGMGEPALAEAQAVLAGRHPGSDPARLGLRAAAHAAAAGGFQVTLASSPGHGTRAEVHLPSARGVLVDPGVPGRDPAPFTEALPHPALGHPPTTTDESSQQ